MEVQIRWDLTINQNQEGSGDDPRLQFAYVTMSGDTPVVLGQQTDLLLNRPPRFGVGVIEGPVTLSGAQTLPVAPTRSDPYLAIAVRAIDEDGSRDSDRTRNFERFIESIQNAATEASPSTLDVDALWLAANAPGLKNRAFRDDDDKIGVSARVHPEFGQLAAAALDGMPEGTVADDFIPQTTLTFQGDGAHWDLVMRLAAIEDD